MSQGLTVTTVRTRAELAELREEWSGLFSLSPGVSGFQSHPWVEACADHLDGGCSLFAAVVRDGPRAVAFFPTQLSGNGRLSFIGREVSNYSGPVFDPGQLEPAVRAWDRHLTESSQVEAVDLSGLRERSPFFALIRDLPLLGRHRPVIVPTNTCPEVDLRHGWSAVLGQHKSKQRSTWKRKGKRLAKLGELEFVETSDPSEIEAALPRMFQLFEQRWAGQRVSAGFSSHPAFQRHAVRRLGAAGLALVSMLRLDGEIVAFSYGIRGEGVTTSYVLAHDDRFRPYSPGLLLLLHVLEAACERGDPSYDFSIGDEAYKSMWVTGRQDVYRALWGRGSRARAARSRVWAAARSVPLLRQLKLQGAQVLLPSRRSNDEEPDAPGLPGGRPGTSYLYRLTAEPSDSPASLRPCSYGEMLTLLSPRLLTLALERSFRGDDLLVVESGDRPLGVVWRTASGRRAEVVGQAHSVQDDDVVYYHPVPAPPVELEDLVRRLAVPSPAMVVTPQRLLDSEAEELGERQP